MSFRLCCDVIACKWCAAGFIRDSHPHSTTVDILKYTIEIVPAAHHLQAMTSQRRRNDIENQVSHYLMPTDLFATPSTIAQLWTF